MPVQSDDYCITIATLWRSVSLNTRFWTGNARSVATARRRWHTSDPHDAKAEKTNHVNSLPAAHVRFNLKNRDSYFRLYSSRLLFLNNAVVAFSREWKWYFNSR